MNSSTPPNLADLLKSITASLGWHRHPRNGKVARLPEATRNLINGMIEDGLPYRVIIRKLQSTVSLPYSFSEMNLSNWYRGGYQDWLQDKLESVSAIPQPHRH